MSIIISMHVYMVINMHVYKRVHVYILSNTIYILSISRSCGRNSYNISCFLINSLKIKSLFIGNI